MTTEAVGQARPVARTAKIESDLMKSRVAAAMWFLLPMLVALAIVAGWPLLRTIYFSLTNTSLSNLYGGDFVGFKNYFSWTTLKSGRTVFSGLLVDPAWWNAVWNTVRFALLSVTLETVLGMIVALVLNAEFKGRGIVRAAILIPWAIPTIVSAKMWALIFDANGVANKLLGQNILWLADNSYSQWAVIVADVWKTAPFIGLLTLAGLQTIPDEVYEAARVDGASGWQQFTRITLPLVQPALVVAVLFRTLDTMRMFDLPFGMIGPGKYSVETLSMFAYFENNALRYGPAAAYSIILFLYIVLVAFLFVKLLGAGVVGDPEAKAMAEARKRRKVAARQAKAEGRPVPKPVRSTITSGDSPS